MNRNTIKQKLLSGGGWSLTGKVLTGLGSIAILGILSRLLTPGELGEYLLAHSLSFFIGISICFGMEQSSLRLISESVSLDRKNNVKQIVFKSIGSVLLVSIIVAFVIWQYAAPLLLKNVFKATVLQELSAHIGLWVIALGFQKLVGEMLRGFHDIRAATLFSGTLFGGVLDVFLYLSVFIGYLVSDETISLETAISISVLISLMSTMMSITVLLRKLRLIDADDDATEKNDEIAFKDILSTSFPIWVSNISVMTMGHADLWIVAAFRTKEELAIYGAITRLVKFISTSLVIVNEVVAPLIAHLNVQGKKEDLEWSLQTTAAIASFLAFPVLLLFILFGQQIIEIVYGPFYIAGVDILVILSLAQVVNVWVGSCGYTLSMTGNGGTLMKISLPTSIISICVALLVVDSYGSKGVAVIMALSILMQQLLMLFSVKTKCGIWTFASPELGFRAAKSLMDMLVSKIKNEAKDGKLK